MNIVIDGKDFTSLLGKCAVTPFFEKVQGPNAGVSMSGTDILDTVRIKNGFEVTAGLMTQDEYSALIALLKKDYLTVTYDDPDTNASVTRTMIVTPGKAKQIKLLTGGYAYKNLPLMFRER